MMKYVQYGCGLSAPLEWQNYDVSPTLRIQNIPVVGRMLQSKLNTVFPENVLYGDIVKGLPVEDNSCDGIYCSHVLEHLSLNDFRTALKNTYRILKPGGIFRCVVPDLEVAALNYTKALASGNNESSIEFINNTLLGVKERPRSMKQRATAIFGNSHHLWMWDHSSLANELSKTGFKNVRRCGFNDSSDPMFRFVENEGRFKEAAALECSK